MKQRQLRMKDTSLESAVQKFLLYLHTYNRSEETIKTYQIHLQHLVSFVGPKRTLASIGQGDVEELLLERDDVAPATKNNWLRTYSSFFSYHQKQVKLNKLKEEQKAIMPFTEEQLRALLRAPDRNTFAGLRDYVLMLLLLDTGIRISEALGLTKNKIFLPDYYIIVTGKGNRERPVPISCTEELAGYLRQIEDVEEYVFISVYGNPLKWRFLSLFVINFKPISHNGFDQQKRNRTLPPFRR